MGRGILLAFFGLAAGGVTAAGIFAFLVAIGLIQRMADKTHTASRVGLYETCFILGGVWGNLVWFYDLPLWGGTVLCAVLGLAYGIFIGCLIMSLAETLNVIPVFFLSSGHPLGASLGPAGLRGGEDAGLPAFLLGKSRYRSDPSQAR